MDRTPHPSWVRRILLTAAALLAILTYVSVRQPSRSAAQGVLPPALVVQIDGATVVGIEDAQVDGVSSEVLWSTNPTTGQMHTRPGNHKPGKLTITKDWSNTAEWYQWRKAVLDGKVDRKSISVIFHNDAGEESARVTLYNCWPSMYSGPSFNAKNSAHAVEKLTLSFEEWKIN